MMMQAASYFTVAYPDLMDNQWPSDCFFMVWGSHLVMHARLRLFGWTNICGWNTVMRPHHPAMLSHLQDRPFLWLFDR